MEAPWPNPWQLATITTRYVIIIIIFKLLKVNKQLYIMVDTICIGLVELWGTPSKWELQNEKFFPTVEVEPTVFRLQVRCDSHCLFLVCARLYDRFWLWTRIFDRIAKQNRVYQMTIYVRLSVCPSVSRIWLSCCVFVHFLNTVDDVSFILDM